jgi:fibronectin type 3 domain-containing protein
MPSLVSRPPLPVHSLHSERTSSGIRLRWKATSADTTSYGIYRRDLAAGDRCPDNDARNLLATVRSSAGQQAFVDTTAVEGHLYVYLVTALDRTWNESVPLPTVSRR